MLDVINKKNKLTDGLLNVNEKDDTVEGPIQNSQATQ